MTRVEVEGDFLVIKRSTYTRVKYGRLQQTKMKHADMTSNS